MGLRKRKYQQESGESPYTAKRQKTVDPTSLDYYPLALDTTSDKPTAPRLGVPLRTSFRIPGAIAIDPFVRALAQVTGMKVSENAVWLLAVAMKEFVKAILMNCISSNNQIQAGELPPFPLIRQRVLHKKRVIGDHKSELADWRGPLAEGGPANCITAADMYVLVSSMSIGNTQSVGGSISRTTFERSLFESLSPSVMPGGTAPDDVRKFITSKLAPPPQKLLKAEEKAPETTSRKPSATTPKKASSRNPKAPKPPSASVANVSKASAPAATGSKTTTPKGCKSPYGGGLGRGAKDLAALKARASFSKKNEQSADVGAPTSNPPSSAPPPRDATANRPAAPGAATTTTQQAASQQAPTSSSSTEERKADDSVTPSPAPAPSPASPDTDQQNKSTETMEAKKSQSAQGVRLGKGFGVKNLAAMRKRSVTQKPPSADDKADAKSDQTQEPES